MRKINIKSKVIVYSTILLIFIFACKSSSNDNNEKNQDLKHVLEINDCDLLKMDSIFLLHKTPLSLSRLDSPSGIVESIFILDKKLNEYQKRYILLCDIENFHFSYGLTIRNNWVRGENSDSLRKELFNELKLTHVDYSSSLILDIYKWYLVKDKGSLASHLIKKDIDSVDLSIIQKINSIENDLRQQTP